MLIYCQLALKSLLFLLFLAPIAAFAQNLVPNPSFEQYSSCPSGLSGPNSELIKAIPWNYPTEGTADYFNACSIIPSSDVPDNGMGTQSARTGVAYAGFLNYHPLDSREYITVQLNSPLDSSKEYCAEMYVSLADDYMIASDGFGMYFSTGLLDTTGVNWDTLPYLPQVTNPDSNIITDKLNWTRVSGSFIAVGGEDHITIGNFSSGQNTDTTFLSGTDTLGYYYIDDVSVVEMDSIPSHITSGTNKIICPGETVTLGAPAVSGYTYQWQGPGNYNPFDAEITVTPPNDTIYVLTITDTTAKPYPCRPTKLDTVEIIMLPCDSSQQSIAWLPNVFSPNADGNNDNLFVRGKHIEEISWSIFNRWGEKVFETTNPNSGWNGTHQGERVNNGVYAYRLHVLYTDGKEEDLSGNVTLVR